MRDIIYPGALRAHDLIGLAAPASPVSREDLEAGIRTLEGMGFRVKAGECLMRGEERHGYLAGGAPERARDLNRLFADPEVRAVFCVRGGYGSVHVLPYLDYDCIRQNPKIFVGYSDITSLHTALLDLSGLATFHGPMVCSNMIREFDEYSKRSLFSALTMTETLEFHNPAGEEILVLRDGWAQGAVTGGNLAVLARSAGTCYGPRTTGRVLFLEDVDETVPRLDMYITQLEYAGVMEQVVGILLGGFTGCSNDRYDPDYHVEDFLAERFRRYPIPVMSRVCSGHVRPMGTLPLGAVCEMDTSAKKITFKSEPKDGSGTLIYRCT